ncbi:methyltransferase family protein [Xenococcus sp. PCC 7305]|uniref:class I SAM-dependent methyltransferase n=1 Tax=Xenococcus sp. PCC 7305 TaxID=102125 RepID=UPI0002AC49C2|nr:class I SAM-dependent methyltransferase [Xenococcus sp. PCC 7305]ELS05591.1 methyltransferase family protein [Xenococcus sp. PCC 7305]
MKRKKLTFEIRSQKNCPACGHHISVPLLFERHPLANTVRPKTDREAKQLERLPLDYVRCVECGHIYNYSFNYVNVPYSDQPYPVFNKGSIWSDFISEIHQEILAILPEKPVVVEVGHGDGSFLARLRELKPEGRYVGFDVNGAKDGEGLVEFRNEIFQPDVHLPELQPDLIVSRHVLEHLHNPLGFLQSIALVATSIGISPLTYFEVPCADRVLETGRTVDFFYEHNSQFTTNSFNKMLSKCSASVERIGYGYDKEVIYGISRLGVSNYQLAYVQKSTEYLLKTANSYVEIKKQLQELYASGVTVAVWGGLGRSSTFMNRYDMNADRFPLVIDSDLAKAGTFVPGTGQEIRFRDWLLENPVDVVIIPSQWRAADIVAEIEREGIAVKKVLIEHDGRLIDYQQERHPYKKNLASEYVTS